MGRWEGRFDRWPLLLKMLKKTERTGVSSRPIRGAATFSARFGKSFFSEHRDFFVGDLEQDFREVLAHGDHLKRRESDTEITLRIMFCENAYQFLENFLP